MTVTLIKPAPAWGVQWPGARDTTTHVDPRESEADARRWLKAIRYCCSTCGPVLVVDDGHGWHDAEGATQ